LITLNGQIDLLRRLGRVPLDPLVDALRDLHARGEAGSENLRALLTAPRRGPANAEEPPTADVTGRPIELSHKIDYETARQHFADHGRRLREQAILAERLLGSFVERQSSASSTSLQHELTVTGPAGSVASTRFVAVNREGRPIEVRFVPDGSCRDGEATDIASRLSFAPPTPRLFPDEEVVVTVSVDMSSVSGPRHTVGVDVRADDRLLVRLWVSLQVTNPEVSQRERDR